MNKQTEMKNLEKDLLKEIIKSLNKESYKVTKETNANLYNLELGNVIINYFVNYYIRYNFEYGMIEINVIDKHQTEEINKLVLEQFKNYNSKLINLAINFLVKKNLKMSD